MPMRTRPPRFLATAAAGLAGWGAADQAAGRGGAPRNGPRRQLRHSPFTRRRQWHRRWRVSGPQKAPTVRHAPPRSPRPATPPGAPTALRTVVKTRAVSTAR
jgi:hypothetical protein